MLTIPWATSTTIPEGSALRQVSRLELTRLRDVPGFLVAALRLRSVVMGTPGAIGVSLRAEPTRRTFWTLSAWQDKDALDAFTRSDYHRSVIVPKDVAKNLGNLHIVIHGADLPGDPDASSLSSLFEATLPVACGEIDKSSR